MTERVVLEGIKSQSGREMILLAISKLEYPSQYILRVKEIYKNGIGKKLNF